MFRAHKQWSQASRDSLLADPKSRLILGYQAVQRKRVTVDTHAKHARILRRVQDVARRFGEDPYDEKSWLMEAEEHRLFRLKGESLGGLTSYVRTMMGMRSRLLLASPGLRDYHAGANRMDPGPDHQAPPALRVEVVFIRQILPFPQALFFWILWKTASRVEDVLGLTRGHLHFPPDTETSPEFGILWHDLTKATKDDVWSIRNTTHVVINPDDPWQMKCYLHLRTLESSRASGYLS